MKINADGLTKALDDPAVKKELTREAANRWFSTSQETLYSAGDNHEFEVYPVAQSAVPPQWDESEGAWIFAYPHVAAPHFEWGTAPHEIEARQAEVLAFEWPDAPQDVQEMFEDTFPTVFFRSVEVDGIPALKFLRTGREEAKRFLESGGGSR